MITPLQALLARTYLRLSQSEAARELGMAHTTLSNIENGQSDPPASRLENVQRFYENAGVEFTEGNGIRRRQTLLKQYDGIQGFRDFMDDVYETAKTYGGDICLFNSKPRLWLDLLGDDWYGMHARRMADLGNDINVRIVVPEGEDTFILDSAEHRCFAKDRWKEKVCYAYGPKIGFLDFGNNGIHIMVFEQSDFAESFKILFDVVWENETTAVKG